MKGLYFKMVGELSEEGKAKMERMIKRRDERLARIVEEYRNQLNLNNDEQQED